ncbi:L,D-transpeptidase [Streptomyces sp. CA-210063]|uniref:L,D-transpeptidase n=1 Tax=Streptomyces sp. CA-210063 TaxID=2801029 RepID=UPI00214C0461|nr:L,D-transpeptidase [Streptomyces sp. CA-210063]UUU32491.1 L,D-transpeptidase [Streptomyces sp. CA-210063]
MSDELTTRLRELAETAETSPPGSGADVRATAGRRRRRRRTTAATAGGCAAAALAAFLTLSVASSHGTEDRREPAASATPTVDVSAAPDATVDLSRRTLTVAGRELPISSGTLKTPTPTGLMTVTAKSTDKIVTGETLGFGDGYEMKLPWVLELTPVEASDAGDEGGSDVGEDGGAEDGADVGDERRGTATLPGTGAERATTAPSEPASGSPTRRVAGTVVYIAALTYDEKAPGTYDTTPGWIGLRTADARWLYERLRQGALVEIRGAPTTPEPRPTGTPTVTPPTTDEGRVVPTALPESASPG